MEDSVKPSVTCGECGNQLLEPVNTPVDGRAPCQACGSTKRRVAVHLTGSVQPSSHMSALHERYGEAIGFSESERQGRTSTATLRDNGSLDISLLGSSPQGEEDTFTACQVLRERLNLDGANWGRTSAKSEPADCVLLDSDDENKALEVQVVRAIVSQNLWRDLNSGGNVQRSLSPLAAAAEIRAAIETKARDAKIPKQTRSKLLLALDATRLPGLAFDAIVRSVNLAWTASQGFAAVWLVGPTSRLVWRLDSESSQPSSATLDELKDKG